MIMEEEEGDGPKEVELPPVLVTFEGHARGLHFDGADNVFVVGRPTSAASYLHLAGHVGQTMPAFDTAFNREVEVCPKQFRSVRKGKQKWTSQVGTTGLVEIVL